MNPRTGIFWSRRFAPFFAVQLTGAYNDNFFRNALVFLITFQLAEAAGLSTGTLVAASAGVFILPFFLFSATGGLLADRLARHRLIRGVKFAEVLLMALVWVGFATASLELLFLALFLTGVQSALFGPVKYAILPNLLPAGALLAGNARVAAGTFAAILLGTLSSGILMADAATARWVPAVLLLSATAGLLASLRIPAQPPANPELAPSWRFLGDTTRVARAGLARPDLRWIILATNWFWMLGTGVLIQLPVHARDVLGGDALALSGLLTIFTVGVGVGALLRPRLGGAEHFQGPPAALVIGACCLALALQTPYAGEARGFLALLADGDAASQLLILFLLACAGGFYIVPLNTRLQRAADNAERARVIACANILSALAMTLISIVGMLAHSRPDGGAVLWGILAASAAAAALLHARVGGGARRLLAWPLASFRAPKPLPPGAVVVARHGGVRAALLLAMAVRGRVELHAPPALARHPALRLLAPVATVRASAFDAPLPEDARRTLILLPAPGPAGGAQLLALLARACDSRRPVVLTHLPHRGPMPDRRIRRTPVHLEALPERPRTAHELYDRLCELEYRLDRHDRTTLASLHAAARRFGPGRVILSDLAGRYSYRKLLQSAYALAALLRRALPGDARTVGVLLPNVFATPATFFALHALGRTPAMLNYTAGAASLESACRTAELTHIVSSRRFIEQAGLAPLAERLAAQVTVLWLEDLRGELTARDKLQAALRAARRPGRGDPNAHAVVLFTSGSEGDPKGVVLSHRNLQRNRAQVRAVLSFYPRDRVLLSLPLFHSFGLGVGLLMPLALGLPCVLATSPLRFKEIPQQIAADRITVFFSTNTFLGGYAQHATRAQLRSLRLTVAGAERLQPAMQELWRERFGIDVQQGYGVTETAPAVSVNAPACARDDTVGRLLPAMELRIAPLPDDPQPERGRLWLRGPNVMLGYWKADRPGVLAPPADGWHDTGDIASLDADGFLRLHGRARRFAKIGGEMVSLEQVEQVVARIWPEHRHLVCAVADARRGEQLVLLTEHPDPDARALADALARQGLPELARPRRIRSIPELPVLGSGKPDLRAGQALAEAVLG